MNTVRIDYVLLCLFAALLAAAASGAGVFLRGDGSYETVTSVRGETYEMATSGVYAFNARRVVAEGVGWDIFTLLLAVPALLISLPWLYRNSLRARLFSVGVLAYIWYQYLMYALTWAFGPLFLLFIAVQVTSMMALIRIVSGIDAQMLASSTSSRFPLRGMAVLSICMSVLLIIMWLARIIGAMRGDIADALYGNTTMVVQALDLGIVVPLAIFTGIMAWRRRPISYLLCTIVVVKSFAMAAAICAMLLSAWVVEGSLELPPFIIFAAAATVSAWLGLRMYANVGNGEGWTHAQQ